MTPDDFWRPVTTMSDYHRGRWTENNSNLETLFFMFCEPKGQELNTTFICKKQIWFFDAPGTPGGVSIYNLKKNSIWSGCVQI